MEMYFHYKPSRIIGIKSNNEQKVLMSHTPEGLY